MTEEIKRMDIAEFRERGYLQEVNRRFLHPLGLALEVVTEDDGSVHLGGIWDYRDDPEGMIFEGIDLAPAAERTDKEWQAKDRSRFRSLGYMIQPRQ